MKQSKKIYKYPVIATDAAIFMIRNKVLCVLLIKMNKSPYQNHWAMPGSLVKGDESIEEGVERVIKEKTGILKIYLEQLYTFGEINRDPFGRVVSVAYLALFPYSEMKLKTTEEHKEVRWFPINNLPLLAYDHEQIMKLAIERLRSKLEYTNVVCHLLPNEFTLTEMQKIYEIILDKKFDKRNFRKKVNSLQIIKETERYSSDGAHRPAKMFRFINKKVQIIKTL